MLQRIKNAIYGWLMAWLAPLYDPHGKPDAAAEPKPYLPTVEAELRAKIGELEADLRDMTAQRDALQEANRRLAESNAELQSLLKERDAKIVEIDHTVGQNEAKHGVHVKTLIKERNTANDQLVKRIAEVESLEAKVDAAREALA